MWHETLTERRPCRREHQPRADARPHTHIQQTPDSQLLRGHRRSESNRSTTRNGDKREQATYNRRAALMKRETESRASPTNCRATDYPGPQAYEISTKSEEPQNRYT